LRDRCCFFHHSVVEHFANDMTRQGYQVVIERQATLTACLSNHTPFEGTAYAVDAIDDDIRVQWQQATRDTSLTIHEWMDDAFFYLTRDDVHAWFSSQQQWKMASFYTMVRKRFDLLMDQGKPVGGKYSFDGANRKRAPKNYVSLAKEPFPHDAITTHVVHTIQQAFPTNPSSTMPFPYAVTRAQAIEAMEHFMRDQLATFGRVQDAMIQGEPFMSHSKLSLYMNNALLTPQEVVNAAIKAYSEGLAPLESVEGFVRQIVGWREYIRGVYQESMPQYKQRNTLQNNEPLPPFYWDAATSMNCLHQTIQETIDYSYNHHIQRLMILSNYANLQGVHPMELSNWFNAMYVDAHDWVVTPNVHGMGLYADGGIMSTKPYISSGNYIHKMSDYCDGCQYDPLIKEGPTACPFHKGYWDFIDRHEAVLSTNPRMRLMYKTKRS